MVTLFFVIALVASIWAFYNDYENVVGIALVSAILSGIYLLLVIFSIAGLVTIDEEIEMYQNENAVIEERIANVVSDYMQYESETYRDFKSEDSIVMLTLYPALKSDTLVIKQIATYMNNHETLLSLKEQKAELSHYKFMLYFGR